jgi:uncharacterized oligopeptide transporter (OPT) family protein
MADLQNDPAAPRIGLFQAAPHSAEELAKSRPLDIPPDEVAEMDEVEWYERAYRGDDVPQLTVRAVLMGSALGFLLAFTNLYIGLKTGWHLGVAITACIMSYAIWQGVVKAGWAKTQMTILENNCMQSTASAAGYSTGGTFVSAIAALMMISAADDPTGKGEHLPTWVYVMWTVFLALLGVVIAIPMKRNMINQEKLKFPSGLAAATTLQSLYADAGEAARKAKALLWSGLIGAAFPLLIEMHLRVVDTLKSVNEQGQEVARNIYGALLPGTSKIFDAVLPGAGVDQLTGEAYKPSDWTIKLDHNPVMIAAGMLVGLRVAVSMLIGGLVLAYVTGPLGLEAAWDAPSGDTLYATSVPGKAWKEIGLWFGAPIMVASGILAFAFQWKTIARAFSGFGKGGGDQADVTGPVEVPTSWFLWGTLVAGSGVVFIAAHQFGVPVHLGALAVVMTLVLALVACRATGESDITPTGAMGKIMQLTYGVLLPPQSSTGNLMSAGITAGAASSSADLLNDLKSGYLLGANPRRQFIAQAMGIISGTVATVTGFYLFVPDATKLTGTPDGMGGFSDPQFPAPAAVAWKAVADLFENGLENMHPWYVNAIFAGLAIGGVLVVLERLVPKEQRKWVPSATGLGLGFILPFYYPFAMFLGALAAWWWTKNRRKSADEFLVPVAAGLIAGISLMGVLAAIMNNFILVNP